MTLKIISADDVIFQGEASAVHLPGASGAFTVLPGHASLISTLTPGSVRFTTTSAEAPEQTVQIAGGVVDVDRDVVSVCIY
ncbi:MAG: ATP synthase F1 subunit epsilon [Duncaniella sp.]|nr:ATP synthase F1 subunit epsilon [Duncaniella sp.]